MHPVLSVSGLFCHRFVNAAVLTHKVTKDSIIKVLFSSISTSSAVQQQRSVSILDSLFLAADLLNGAATISLFCLSAAFMRQRRAQSQTTRLAIPLRFLTPTPLAHQTKGGTLAKCQLFISASLLCASASLNK